MQKRRTVRKIIQEPNAIEYKTNIQRRNTKEDKRSPFVKPPSHYVPKHIELQNASQPLMTKIVYATVPKLYDGETIYIIGGGPSLKNFKFESLNGCRTIAINKAILFYPDADVLYWTDGRFYTWYKNEVDNYKGLKYSLKGGSQYTQDINILKKGEAHGLSKDPQTLSHGFNSGYAAINLAYHLGAKRIILLGFDMGSDGTLTHFHDGYPSRSTGEAIYRDRFIPSFNELKTDIKELNLTILNASPYSKLNVFPKITLDQALSFR